MANSQEQDKEYRGILNTILYMGYAVLLFHFYVFCNNVFQQLGIPLGLLDRFIRTLNNSTHVFEQVWYSKLAALFLLLVYVLGNVSKKKISATWNDAFLYGLIGILLYFGSTLLLTLKNLNFNLINLLYVLSTVTGFLILIKAAGVAGSIINLKMGDDPWNEENESFMQETRLMETEYSVNIPTLFRYKNKILKGWINIVNPFRAAIVLGTPGSGKTFAIINNYIKQQIEKGYTMYVYDFKFPDLSRVAYHYFQKNKHVYQKMYGIIPKFVTINFDDPRRSNRCNPLIPSLMTDIIDASEASTTVLLNLSKAWVQKQGEFFTESPIKYFTACIWYMKLYHDKKVREFLQTLPVEERTKPGITNHINYCTFPHIIEFAAHDYEEVFPLIYAEPELENNIKPFFNALKNGAKEQLEGQIASALLPLSTLNSKTLYWVMTGDEFTLDINNPKDPKILCAGNNPDRQVVYGAALGLYNARLVKLVNRKDQLKSSIIVDELPTIYFRGLNTLIATARSNRVSTILGLQDLSQLIVEYGKDVAQAIFNTIGNVFSGQVFGETAKTLSSRFGKIVQQRQSFNVTEKETTTNFSTQMDSVIPESKISNLSQGNMVGAIADEKGQEIQQKMFHAQIVISQQMIDELKKLPPIPPIEKYSHLSDEELMELVDDNYKKVKTDVNQLIKEQLDELRNGERSYLLSDMKTADPNYLTGSIPGGTANNESNDQDQYDPTDDEYSDDN